jgi:hypothetical protein
MLVDLIKCLNVKLDEIIITVKMNVLRYTMVENTASCYLLNLAFFLNLHLHERWVISPQVLSKPP